MLNAGAIVTAILGWLVLGGGLGYFLWIAHKSGGKWEE
jgi:hypothetical protein